MQHTESEVYRGEKTISKNRIAVIVKPKVIEYLPYEYNEIGPDEVLVKMVGCGLDHNDILFWEGRDWIDYPVPSGVPGREGWGIIEKAGKHTSRKPGEVVAVFTPNALSSYVICKHDQIHLLPHHFKNLNFPARAFAYAINIYQLSKIREGDVITILGNGFTSSVLHYLAKLDGAVPLKIAYAGNYNNGKGMYTWGQTNELIAEVNNLTDGKGCNQVIECTGTTISCDLATSLVREEGKLILARQTRERKIKLSFEDPCDLDIVMAHDQSLQDLHEGVDRAIELIEQGKLNTDDFIAEVYPFDQLKQAFNELCRDAGEYKKMCIRF